MGEKLNGSSTRSDETDVVMAFFDVLGFSERVKNIGLKEIFRQYQKLVSIVKKRTEGRVIVAPVPTGDGQLALIGGHRHLQYAYFSDTVLIWTKYDIPIIESFLDSILEFFCEALIMGIPLRGCVTFGKAIMDSERSIFLGEPIIEGYLGEGAQSWVGVSFGPSLSRYPWLGALRHVIPFNRQIKDGKEKLVKPLVLDWPRRWRESFALRHGRSPNAQLNLLNTDSRFSRYYTTAQLMIFDSEQNQEWWKNYDFNSQTFFGHALPQEEYNASDS
jgi:hypothetical protein